MRCPFWPQKITPARGISFGWFLSPKMFLSPNLRHSHLKIPEFSWIFTSWFHGFKTEHEHDLLADQRLFTWSLCLWSLISFVCFSLQRSLDNFSASLASEVTGLGPSATALSTSLRRFFSQDLSDVGAECSPFLFIFLCFFLCTFGTAWIIDSSLTDSSYFLDSHRQQCFTNLFCPHLPHISIDACLQTWLK